MTALPADVAPASPAPPAPSGGRERRFVAARDVVNGIVAIGVKELRGRMRGKRAFVVLTVHLMLVAGFAWMIETLSERSVSFGGSVSASADIGRQLFTALTVLLTVIVLVLAPASTAGAISLEREKQTLDLLATTPISSLAIVLGKLLSALTWVFLLLLASIPVMALVFTFGGVGPEDLVRAYVVLVFTAFAFGSMGLFVSALVKRTQAATMINLVATIGLTVGATVVFVFWGVFGGSNLSPDQTGGAVDSNPIGGALRRPPEAVMWFNPVVAQIDVLCGTETGFGASCQIIAGVTNNNSINNAIGQGPNFVAGGAPLGIGRDTYWPRSVAAMAIASLLLVVWSVQLVSPTRRWRFPRPRRRARAEAGA